MRRAPRIAVVGAGQAGLQLAFGLLARGYVVTVCSDRTPDEILSGRALATAFMFARAVGYERELGLSFWEADAPLGDGVRLDYHDPSRGLLVETEGRFEYPGEAVDQRMKYSRWLRELELRGGQLVTRSVEVGDLEELTERSDLVCVAAGRGEISALFERDDERSVFHEPQRKLALVVVFGVEDGVATRLRAPLKLGIVAAEGEILWMPFLHKSGAPAYAVLFEARPAGQLDRFGPAADGEEMLAIAKRTVAELCPWESEALADVHLADPLAWAKGAITPIVRRPVGRLPSGRVVMAIGDTAVLNDPIAAQGSNAASKTAHRLVRQIVDQGRNPYDAAWIEEAFEDLWESELREITAMSTMLLEPFGPPLEELLVAASRSEAVADSLCECFNEPARLAGLIAGRTSVASRPPVPTEAV